MRTVEPAGVPGHPNRPLTGAEIVVVIVVMILAAALTLAGMPAFGIVELLGGTTMLILRLLRPAPGTAPGHAPQ
ncbi:hypothetical protein ACFU3J_27900 [Streptomyces sp. NPDC057411]|uniref:hypothetical protein n=1 Tax=unclassified Streptomyces TaxID=2593676 RepID=UPI0036277DA8